LTYADTDAVLAPYRYFREVSIIPHRILAMLLLGGLLPEEGSFLSVEPEQALLSALFAQANRVYARLWNGSPNRVEANLGGGGPLSLHACSLDLREGETVERIGLAPWGLGTLRLGGTQG